MILEALQQQVKESKNISTKSILAVTPTGSLIADENEIENSGNELLELVKLVNTPYAAKSKDDDFDDDDEDDDDFDDDFDDEDDIEIDEDDFEEFDVPKAKPGTAAKKKKVDDDDFELDDDFDNFDDFDDEDDDDDDF